jgi:tRNA A37 threonylcarbamoyladenosine dehydratase
LITAEYDFVLDAIDNPSLKALLIATCREAGVPVLVSGGAGGRRDPTAVTIEDLAYSSHDRLLQVVRKNLRKDYAFPRGDKPFNVSCVLSREQPVFPTAEGSVCTDRASAADLRLDCRSGFGTASFVTGTFGLVAASRIVAALTATEPKGRIGGKPVAHRETQPLAAELPQQGI